MDDELKKDEKGFECLTKIILIKLNILKIFLVGILCLIDFLFTFPLITLIIFLFFKIENETTYEHESISTKEMKVLYNSKKQYDITFAALGGILFAILFPYFLIFYIVIITVYFYKYYSKYNIKSFQRGLYPIVSNNINEVMFYQLVISLITGTLILYFGNNIISNSAYLLTLKCVSIFKPEVINMEYPLGRMGGMSIAFFSAPKLNFILGSIIYKIKRTEYIGIGFMLSPILYLVIRIVTKF